MRHQSVPGHVADDKSEPSLGEGDRAVPIAADLHPLGTRHISNGDLNARNVRGLLRKKGALKCLSDRALLFEDRPKLFVKIADLGRILLRGPTSSHQTLSDQGGGNADERTGDPENPGEPRWQGTIKRLVRRRHQREHRVAPWNRHLRDPTGWREFAETRRQQSRRLLAGAEVYCVAKLGEGGVLRDRGSPVRRNRVLGIDSELGCG